MPPISITNQTSKGALRLRSLTDAASVMFLKLGYEAVSVDALIRQVGGSRRNVYQTFDGKEGLFIEVVMRLCYEIAEPLRQLDIQEIATRAALTKFGRSLLVRVMQPRTLDLHRLMIAEGHRFPKLSQAIRHAGHDTAVRILADWISQRPVGEFGSTLSAQNLAIQFVNMLVTGPQMRALAGEETRLGTAMIATMVEETVDLFLDGALKGKHSNDR